MAQTPYHDRDGFIWMDGKMLPWRDAKVHFLTHALHYGTQVFEGERAYDGKIFKSRQHSQRLINSAKILYMDMPVGVEEIEDIKYQVLKANGLDNAYVRAAAWRGSEQMGIDVAGTEIHVAVAAWDWGQYFSPGDAGISLGTSRWRKPAPDTAPTNAKTASLYNLSCLAKFEAKQSGFADALMLDYEGFVAESTGANLFAVQDERLITPLADRFLNGLTRQTVIEIAAELDISVEQRRIKPEELSDFEEIFVTGSAAELTAVGKIDTHEYRVGPVTKKLQAAYSALVRS
ncbi:MAG: branched-chain amino acid aminotransferase [Alphaproteobacteria bacterium]|nr:branched-chain amino acid aminotransferase [Alphaproteobacteria bacterium]